MSWSLRITFLYLGFVALILSLVFICFGHKTELEYKDYYARELQFQDQIDATRNANALTQPIDYKIGTGSVEIIFPQQFVQNGVTGDLHFLRPSDSDKDLLVEIRPAADGIQHIPTNKLEKGVYKLRISAESQGKAFFKEAVINLP